MAKIDKLTGLFKLDPEEEKEIDDRIKQGEAMKKGMEILEESGVDFGDIKSQLDSTIKLGKQLQKLANSVKKSTE